MLRLATWNVNSLKARLPRVEEWIDEFHPDVLCLQETKLADHAFPDLVFRERGYESAHHGQGQWNGVAVLSKVGLSDVRAGWDDGGDDDTDARLLWATCGPLRVANAYVPNGRSLDDDHYTYKLSWLARLRATLDTAEDPSAHLAVVGDFNIAPDDRDVHDPAAFEGATHVSAPEREALARIEDWGLTDVFREHYDAGGLYSWWDYRRGDFHQGRGMRIDLVLTSASLTPLARTVLIDRNARKGKQPSDHAPVVVDLDL